MKPEPHQNDKQGWAKLRKMRKRLAKGKRPQEGTKHARRYTP